MTQTEQDAKWIKAERKKMARLIGSISTIISEQALLNPYTIKYEMSFELGMVGGIQLRIYKQGTNEPMEKLEVWNIDSYFEYGRIYFNKEVMQKEINSLSTKVNEVKQLAQKYAKLNLK